MSKVQQGYDFLQQFGPWAVPMVLGLMAVVLGVVFYFLQGPIKAIAERASIALGWVAFILKFLFPPALVAMAYAFPSLHIPAALNFPPESSKAIIVIGVIGGVWVLVFQTMGVNNPLSTLRDVVKDFLVSLAWMLIFYGWAMQSSGEKNLEMWLALPTVFFVADIAIGTIVGFRNMFQKSPIQPDKGGI